jgi:hypothetical protein
MYGGSWATFDGIHHTIGQLDCVVKEEVDEEEFPAMVLIDTAGCDLLEAENASGSRYDEGEADLVVSHVQKLLDLGVPQEEVALISPTTDRWNFFVSVCWLNTPTSKCGL